MKKELNEDSLKDAVRPDPRLYDAHDRDVQPQTLEWKVLLAQELLKLPVHEIVMWCALLKSPHNFARAARIAQVTYNEMTAFRQRLRRRLRPAFEALKSQHHWR